MNWKILSIILIIIVLLESALLFWVFAEAFVLVQNDDKCEGICSEHKADGYYYFSETNSCGCYDVDGNVLYSQKMT